MSKETDIALVKRQETELVLPALDEAVAFQIGSSVIGRARDEKLSLVVDIRTWDRQLFFAATAGTSFDNAEWVRRKINTVRRFQRASYRMVLERGEEPFRPQSGADISDYVIAGGGFPLSVPGAKMIGALTISGLPGRRDHGIAVDALADFLGRPRSDLALPEHDA